jgi:malonyl-CoA decarboxylase
MAKGRVRRARKEKAMGRSYLAKLMQGFSEQRSKLLHKCAPFLSEGARSSRPAQMCALAGHLLSSRGEASGVAIATDLLDLYAASDPEERTAFLAFLARDLNPNRDVLERAWQRFGSEGWPALPQLAEAVEAPRQELFRRINLAPGGTAALVRMREDLLAREGLAIVDADLSHLLQSWFNRGFLSLKAITWSSPASLLERVIQYEAVHSIHDWDELRNRLAPPDRRCFAFFHPAMPDEPLIFDQQLPGGPARDFIRAFSDQAGRD